MSNSRRRGILFVVSAPSGAGKTTVVRRLAESVQNLKISCSYTSRPARPGERDGHDYHFVSRGRFEKMVRELQFLEFAEVFGNLYGTSRDDTERLLTSGVDVVLVIDVQGARQVRQIGMDQVSAFILPPSFTVLEERLRGRSKDEEEQIIKRLRVARSEVGAFYEYDYVVVNREIETCVEELAAIVTAERCRLKMVVEEAEAIAASFDQSRDAGR
jgi:guanylate kinase